MKNKKKFQQSQRPTLMFSPTAWAKLVYLRDMTDNEVGGFGITEEDDLLFVKDIALVKQKVTSVSVSFDDDAVADFYENQVEEGRTPQQFARLWIHSHPGTSPEPSLVDEETFQRVFGSCDWAVMFILAQDGSTYARLRFNAGPGGEVKLPVCVNYNCRFAGSDIKLWEQQYCDNVVEEQIFSRAGKSKSTALTQQQEDDFFGYDGSEGIYNFINQGMIDEIDSMDPMERQYLMEELAERSQFWDESESEVLYE